ncbi:CPBP family glutamic-type intramembrane protease [Winogradskyella eximia]|uniref:CPBP family glutamic-type intramembrane protease n=1 Tax=Winogradskyella eximia TaxID=262006 RepID=UPI002490690C|nr:CPBP family glutamic-type intramembrane protease [Winogradskyella eximia]
MTILKAILLTLLLIFLFSLTQLSFVLLIYKTELLPEYFEEHILITTSISFIVAYLAMFKYFWKPKLNINKALDIKSYNPKFLPSLILIVFGLQFLDRPFWDLGKIWNYFNYSEFEPEFSTFKGFSPAFFYQSFSMLIIAPILEELFFRKFLLKKLMIKNGQKVGIIISSFCFAIIHIETPYNLIPTFIFGIISSLIFIKTKKIGYSIFLHFLVNLLVQTLYVFDSTFDRWLLDLNFNYIYWIMFIVGIGLTFIGTKNYWQHCIKKIGQVSAKPNV